ncbi:hypothetical protein D9757_002737 [Collybiopsis confluens]|uniref:Argonaute-like protein n=1 Tax=Collybiopsis confluens TaxID=2823264 RepID=A0A8H5HW44_9AGAR|nr:hypothetical protein D9757_002737 [Collybiopsis confluens]
MPPRSTQRAKNDITSQASAPQTASHVATIGVKRSAFGTSGRPLPITVNAFAVTIPQDIIYHHDIVIYPAEKVLPVRMNMELIRVLQERVAPDVFHPPCVYDGRKNLFSSHKLQLGSESSREFDVTLELPSEVPRSKGPKVYKIRITEVAQINPEVLQRFIAGKQSHDNAVLTAITALNVVIRMEPTMKYPFNVRSFFTDQEKKDIGGGLELWRGYFQSVRPASGRMLINIDISSGTMYKPGPLINLCLDFFGKSNPNILAPSAGLPDRERLRLQRFISGIRVETATPDGRRITRIIKKLSKHGAAALSFNLKEGGSMTVSDYFRNVIGHPLKLPQLICIEIGSGALLPLELCTVPPGQIMRKQVPPEKTKTVLDFATKQPAERLRSIQNGLDVLSYGQSEYVRNFGISVAEGRPMKMQARVLAPPVLKVDKKFFRPSEVPHWAIVIYERKERFNEKSVEDMIQGLRSGAGSVGIRIDQPAVIQWENGQGNIANQLKAVGKIIFDRYKKPPSLMVVVLPEGGNDIYTSVKHFGDITMGIATQCLNSFKCFKAKRQYYSNVMLKINVKLGGINAIPDQRSVQALSDPSNPTIVMVSGHAPCSYLSNPVCLLFDLTDSQGADVIHPAPGSDGRPSFTALVASVDSNNAKYVAECAVQTSRKEIVEELESMAKKALQMYIGYRTNIEKKAPQIAAPKRIIFYRDGVSEGQFKQVLDQELTALKKACASLNINAKITFIVVGKRHHIRFFPTNKNDEDKSGNCPAGTVVDRDITHPTEFDFYLQSHGGLLGTSRPAHYSILHDDNAFSPDTLQSLSFALCHVYARSTRSVSIPAPVYYADIVCSRAKNHYDPESQFDFSDSNTVNSDAGQAQTTLEAFRANFKPLNPAQKKLMYFSVRLYPCLNDDVVKLKVFSNLQ